MSLSKDTKITIHTTLNAPIERCFDLSRSIDLHTISTSHTHERAVAGITSGLIKVGEFVTWEARHFGAVQQMTSRIPEMEHPHYFISVMEKGAFKSFRHIHEFKENNGQTIMLDHLTFRSPLGILGRVVDALVLRRYMTNLLVKRNATIKAYAKSNQWKTLLVDL